MATHSIWLVIAAAVLLVSGPAGSPLGSGAAPVVVQPPVVSAAQLPPLIPRETFFGNPSRMNPRVSPDGTSLLYTAPDVNGVLQLWVRTLGQLDDRQVTNAPPPGPWFASQWGYNNRHVIYLQDREGNENYHIYTVDLETGSVRDLTPFEDARAAVLLYVPTSPNEMLVALNARDPALFDVYHLNLVTGELDLLEANPGSVRDWQADRQLAVRAATIAYPDGSGGLQVRASADAPWRVVRTWGPDDALSIVGFGPDGGTLYLLSNLGANARRLVALDLATDMETVLAEDPQYDGTEVLIDPLTGAAQAVLFLRERRQWQALDPALGPDLARLQRVQHGDVWTIERDLADRIWIVAYRPDDGPVTYYVYHRADEASVAEPLFSTMPELDNLPLARMQPISYQARDELIIHGYLTPPVGVPARGLPAVLLVHGGPIDVRDEWGFNPEVQWLANRGYAVLQVNFRGSGGYGKAFENAGNGEWAGRMHDDLIDGVRWLVGQDIADAERIAIMGGSYGGYATLVALTFTPAVFAAGVDLAGPSNLITLQEAFPPYFVLERGRLERAMGGSSATNPEFLRARSPLFFVDRIQAPLLIGQGANDPRVTQAEAEQMVAALRAASRPVEYVLYPDEGHGLARPENRLHFYGRVEEFLARHLGGRFEPAMPVPGSSGAAQ